MSCTNLGGGKKAVTVYYREKEVNVTSLWAPFSLIYVKKILHLAIMFKASKWNQFLTWCVQVTVITMISCLSKMYRLICLLSALFKSCSHSTALYQIKVCLSLARKYHLTDIYLIRTLTSLDKVCRVNNVAALKWMLKNWGNEDAQCRVRWSRDCCGSLCQYVSDTKTMNMTIHKLMVVVMFSCVYSQCTWVQVSKNVIFFC